MNIFVLDETPKKAARMLCDCHLHKMCVETSQILSAVLVKHNTELLKKMPNYQKANHPVIVALYENDAALDWVLAYNHALHFEYYHRFRKAHAYSDLTMEYISLLWSGTEGDCSGLKKCCGNLKVRGMDIVSAYRKYYTEVKKPQLTAKNLWKFTNRKDWTNEQN